MAAPIGPGDFVECIRSDGTAAHVGSFSTGALYCVEEIDPPDASSTCEGCDGSCLGLSLVGMPRPRGANSFWAGCAFKPVYRPRAEFIQSLKAPPINAPARVNEDA